MTAPIAPEEIGIESAGRFPYFSDLALSARVAAVILAGFVMVAITGPLWAPYGPAAVLVGSPFAPPSMSHPFGTDDLGRDVFSRVIFGSRAALITSVSASGLAVVLGTVAGLMLAYWRGWIDELGMRLIDILMSVPPLILALLLLSAGGSDSLLPILAVAILFAPRVTRVVRAAALAIVTEDYVTAAVTRGESALSIAWRELLPNVAGTVFVEFSIRTGFAVVFIGALGFLGFGAAPPSPEWGLMIGEGRSSINASFWPVIAPALSMAVLVISVNLFTEGLARLIGQSGRPSIRE